VIIRYTSTWTGFSGAPGYTNLYASGPGTAQSFAAAVGQFWESVSTQGSVGFNLPTGVRITPASFAEQVDETTGELIGTLPLTASAPTTGTQTAGYSAVSGACINWLTGGIVNGKRVRGRTFIVPLGGNCYDTDGSLTANFLTAVRAAAATLVSASDLAIWHRPTTPGGTDGSAEIVSASSVNDKISYLSSRRD
jgi:hypothetical protein